MLHQKQFRDTITKKEKIMKPFNESEKPRVPVFKKIGDYVLHGDVVIQKVSNLENFDQLDKSQDSALAYGEATGHIHQLGDGEFDLRIDSKNPNNRHLKIVTPTMLRHQEHLPIVLPPGDYITRIQREYDPFEKKIREVID